MDVGGAGHGSEAAETKAPAWKQVAVSGIVLAALSLNIVIAKQLWDRTHLSSTVSSDLALSRHGNVVVVETQYSAFNPLQPWQVDEASADPGIAGAAKLPSLVTAGIVVGEGLVLTAGLAAVDSRVVRLRRPETSELQPAKVLAVAGDLDVALLSFQGDVQAGFIRGKDAMLEMDSDLQLPALGTEIVLVGLGTGALFQTVIKMETRVSKITYSALGLSGRHLAPPLPMLSVYPPIDDSFSVLGIALAKDNDAVVGFVSKGGKILPASIVASFVKWARSGRSWPGLPSAGVLVRSMQAPALRKFWGLSPDGDVGVQVRTVAPDSALHGRVAKGDILLAIDGESVRADGGVSFGGKTGFASLPWEAAVASKPYGQPVTFTFCRASITKAVRGRCQEHQFDVRVVPSPPKPLVRRALDRQPMEQPPYFILGGLVFSVYSEALAVAAQRAPDEVTLLPSTQAQLEHRWRVSADEEPVVLLRKIEHTINRHYDSGVIRVVKYFNDKPVVNLAQLLRDVGAALSDDRKSFLTFAFAPLGLEEWDDTSGGIGDPDVVLKRSLLAGVDVELMAKFEIGQPASADLMATYTSAMPSGISGRSASTVSKPVAVSVVGSAGSNHSGKGQEPRPFASHMKIPDVPWENVVKITLYSAERSLLFPWKKMTSSGEAGCTGIIVDVAARRILTNSHCVRGAKRLELARERFPYPAPARIIEFARDIDVAWITTDEPSFWASGRLLPKIKMSKGLPALSSAVYTVGYPLGGSSITITRGIVSRLEGKVYAQELQYRSAPDNLLYLMVDAAINGGNSGGPVFNSDAELVGLAFAKIVGGQREGLVIPNGYLQNFADSVLSSKAKRWVAQPESGLLCRPVANPSLREYLNLRDNEGGLQIRSVAPGSPLHSKVRKGDILLSVDGTPINEDGRIMRRNEFGQTSALPFDTVISGKASGQTTAMTFLRVDNQTGARHTISLFESFGPIAPLAARFDDSPLPLAGRENFSVTGSYFIQCGFVWGVFSAPLASDEDLETPWSLQQYALNRWREDPDEEIVVLLSGFPREANIHYDTRTMRVLDRVNGHRVKNMAELVHRAMRAESDKTGDMLSYTFKSFIDLDAGGGQHDPDIVLSKSACAETDKSLLQDADIPSRVSLDLQKTFEDARSSSSSLAALMAGRTHRSWSRGVRQTWLSGARDGLRFFVRSAVIPPTRPMSVYLTKA